jgi:hypothetical protein
MKKGLGRQAEKNRLEMRAGRHWIKEDSDRGRERETEKPKERDTEDRQGHRESCWGKGG